MPGFALARDYVDAVDTKSFYSTWRKTPSAATTAGIWFDLSLSPGNPNPQYYAATPLAATPLARSTDGGLNHGGNVSTSYKFLERFLMMSASATGLPMSYILCDYLMFYPFIDTGSNDEQAMTNSVTIPRYTDGKGVQIMCVSVAPNTPLNPNFTVNYTNSSGVAGRTSRTMTLNAATANGSILTADTSATITATPFIGLQSGDTGVRSIESCTITTGSDVGLFALVLVKPLVTGCLLEQTAPCEIVPIATQAQLPRIYDDAYLNIICLPNGSLSGVALHGEIRTVFG